MVESSRTQRRSGVAVICSGAYLDEGRLRTRGVQAGVEPDRLVEGIGQVDDDVLQIVDSFDVLAAPAARGMPTTPPSVELEIDPAPGIDLALVLDESTGLWRWEFPTTPPDARTRAAPVPTRFVVRLGSAPAGTRGIGGALVGRLAKFVIVRVGDELIAKGAEKLAELFENRRRKGGLRTFGPDDYLRAKPDPSDQLRAPDVRRLAEGSSLLFLHGTMSLAHSGFGRLPAELVGRCFAAYDGRVWAFDHHTLSRSPEQNARDLVTRLREMNAPRLTVDVLAHSRGGLVARELAALQSDDAPLAIRSITFVATPNEGTPLCDVDQLQRFVDRFTNLLAFVPDNPVTDVIDAVGSVAATLALRAAEGLVGLRAMDPNGAYLRDLAERRLENEVRYRAITSNFDPTANTKLGDRLRDAAIDKLFGAANDLIVPTASAYGSKERPLVEPENRYEFDTTQGVDHSSFWDKAQFAECIDRWLGLATPVSVRTLPADATTQQVVTVDHARDAATETTEDLDDDATQTVTVTPVHGSLEHAAHPLIVGHYRGVALDGAGSFLDARLGRRLSTRMMLGRFPEQIGESIIVDNGPSGDEHHGYPPGALVVGLGPPGELTREKLTATLAAAMLRYAIEVFDGQRPHRVDDDGVARLCLSAVPVGTSSAGGISTEACVAALVDALVSVNDQLYRHTAPGRGACWDSVRISALEIVALWEDRAELVAHALNRLPQLLQVDLDTELLQKGIVQHSQHSRLDLCTRLVVREGALRRRPQSEERAGEWQRLIIRNRQRERTLLEDVATTPSGAITLEFTAVGGRARADRIDVTLDAAAVELLIASATTEAGPRDQVNRTLYELLLPTQLKQDLFRFDNLQFIVDENTADFPWEALAAGAGRELGIRSGLLRQFQEFEGIRHDVRTPIGDHVLVIGDPPAAPLPSLPGASAEAKTVADVLGRDSFDVKGLIWNDNASIRDDFPNLRGNPGRRILNALFAEEWRVIHVASHGQFDADDSSRSGAVIDKDVFFTANVARQLPVVPELVFLNCCHLGKQDDSLVGPRNPNRLAASVARELMRIGVRAVVAAGWAVDDQPAADFARHFYAELLDGSLLGDAVHIARRRIHNEHAHSMTWGAFQCYGDPSFRLREPERRRTHTRRFVGETLDEHTEIFVSEAELVRRVQTIRAEAGKIGLPGFDELRRAEEDLTAELRRYRQRLDSEEWSSWATPPVLAEFGAAFGELGRYADAVSCYRVAWADGTSQDVPMRALEQLGNLEIRLAQQLARGGIDAAEVEAALGSHGHSVDDLVASAKIHLQLALQVGVTGERLALIGSFHKKAATLKSGAERTAELEQSCAQYHQAQLHELERTTADQDGRRVAQLSTYYTHVWLQMAALAGEEVDDSLANALLDAIRDTPNSPTVFLDACGQPVEKVTPERADDRPYADYWSRVARANNLLTRAVRSGEIDLRELETEYRDTFRTRATKRNRDSTVDHLRDLAVLMGNGGLDALAADLMRAAEAPT